jgi:hypothetical protein
MSYQLTAFSDGPAALAIMRWAPMNLVASRTRAGLRTTICFALAQHGASGTRPPNPGPAVLSK